MLIAYRSVPMVRLFRFLKPYLGYVSITVALLLIQAASELSLPSIMADIVDRGVRGGVDGVIFLSGAKMAAMTVIGVIASVGVGFAASRTSAGFTRDLRQSLFERVQSFSLAEFDSLSTASLLTRTTNDVTHLQHIVSMFLRMLLFAPVMGFGSLVMAIRTSYSMSWILALAVFLVSLMVVVMVVVAMPRFKLIQGLVDRLNLIGREHLDGIMVIRAYGAESFEMNRFDEANSELTAVNLFVNRMMSALHPSLTLVMNGCSLLIVWIGSKHVAASSLEVGQMMAYLQYAMHVIMSFLMISMMFIMIPRAAVSAKRISEVLAVDPSITDPEKPEALEASAGSVEFRGVSFKYEGAEEDALCDVSFSMSPGETVALVGPTGAGKSTLANLIPRFYDASGGSVLVGGKDVRALSLAELRSRIGFCHQKAALFSGSIADNIRYGNQNADEAGIEAAASTAQALDFISELEGGFESRVAEGGSNLSGGQRQRIAIARALARNPDLYVFDDSFSALDGRTDARLRAALKKRTKSASVLVVSQKIETVKHADRIVVLDDGRIAGSGTHEELLLLCPLYKQLAESQNAAEVRS
ncbi:MAG TPA: ABC transporter ATP-binding protein [Treponemataceae bacterium]|nr:ABC transporter ATP-binding protein [Treponemataceae bacterium]